MRIHAYRRRGMAVAMVVMVGALLAGIFAVLAICSVGQHRAYKQDELDRAARLSAASAVAWVERHPDVWLAASAGDEVVIDVAALMPPRAVGRAVLRYVEEDGERVGEMAVEVARGRMTARTRIVVSP